MRMEKEEEEKDEIGQRRRMENEEKDGKGWIGMKKNEN